MLPVLAGYIASSIGDRPALAVGFVGGMVAANGKSGFLGALVAGFLAGYLILALKKIFSKLPESIEKITPVLLYPLFGILLIGLIMIYIVEPPIGALNTGAEYGAYQHERKQQDPARHYRGGNDVHRHGRPVQQSGVCVRNSIYRGRKL